MQLFGLINNIIANMAVPIILFDPGIFRVWKTNGVPSLTKQIGDKYLKIFPFILKHSSVKSD